MGGPCYLPPRARTASAAAPGHPARLWREDEELRQFRDKAVLAAAERLRDSGGWEAYREPFAAAHGFFHASGDEADRALLQAMIRYLVRSLFERCVAGCDPSLRQRLVVQRRMIEPIAAIVREPVYKGDYRSPGDADLRACGVVPLTTPTFTRPVLFLDTSLQPRARAEERMVGNGFVNELECEWVASACRRYERELRLLGGPRVTVSVLCFDAAQAREVRRLLGAPRFAGFHRLGFQVIDAVDRIQGQESDLVFLTFGRTHFGRPGPLFGQWLQDLRRLNVACTRAHRALVFVGQKRMLERLCSSPESQAFYAHLLGLFAAHPESMQVVQDYRG